MNDKGVISVDIVQLKNMKITDLNKLARELNVNGISGAQ